MRIVSYDAGGDARPGAVRGGDVVDLGGVAESVLTLIDGGNDALDEARRVLESAPAVGPLDEIRLFAPIPRPRSHLYCVGWNYPRHYDEGVGKRAGQESDEREFPAFFTKPPATVIGPDEAISWDGNVTEKLDYEAELAVVVGKDGRSIREEDFAAYVFGYTLANDVSARDVQRRHGGQWLKGKGMDTYCPLGPVIVTADELDDPRALRLTARVNGEPRQDDVVGNMIFPLERILRELSFGLTLRAGDVVLTGTPAGVGFAREPKVFLVPGDVVEVEIPEIGVLRNPVANRSLTAPEVTSAAVHATVAPR
jgi:2,4-didehydro-3-deoxy-L-rhamnonate hydrolase